MALDVKLTDIGNGLTEAEIVSWLVSPGDTVTVNQALVEVETDKAVVEISTPQAGTVVSTHGNVGDTISVGDTLVVIGDADTVPAETPDVSGAFTEVGITSGYKPNERTMADVAPQTAPQPVVAVEVEPSAEHPVRAMPLIRKLAREHQIDLAAVTPSGSHGQITRADVMEVVAARGAAKVPAVPRAAMSKLRRTIAAHMTRSWEEIPHVTVWGPAEATRLIEARKRTGLPLDALLIRAMTPSLAEYADFNSSFDGETLTPNDTYDIGIAVDTDAGLLVPVVKDVTGRNDNDLAKEIDRLVVGAKSRTLGTDDLTGQTWTISNVGAVGGRYGTPIIPIGTTSIIAVGRARDEVVARYGQPVVAPMMPLALSFDHRVIDGAQASRFLEHIIESIELFRI
jgi:pyruvate dehydrogenase E2 component (dihydrolipoamide acetyltransferase)